MSMLSNLMPVLLLLVPVSVILVNVLLYVIQFNDRVITISAQDLFPFSFGSPMGITICYCYRY